MKMIIVSIPYTHSHAPNMHSLAPTQPHSHSHPLAPTHSIPIQEMRKNSGTHTHPYTHTHTLLPYSLTLTHSHPYSFAPTHPMPIQEMRKMSGTHSMGPTTTHTPTLTPYTHTHSPSHPTPILTRSHTPHPHTGDA